ncbi:hypothetical protein C8F04DRAFT_1185153 [Mycena alexandri]|uniref:F-box domain-containing protein n=1 Tax=Mycena alexandri TaxID=1745969 RepID=A0AAD6STH1_9AGAR|nr:hypothetical protein C8F04DRAFT_1185153 [Mycena alexandri]
MPPPESIVVPAAHPDYATASDLPLELWAKCICALILDGSLSPKHSAEMRGFVACVCKEWHSRVYTMSEFWSTITIFKSVPIDRLDFVLSKCASGPIHIKLHLRDVRSILGKPPTVWNVALMLDAIFEKITPYSTRWTTFQLITENPFVFRRVHHLCKSLPADSLSNLHMAYIYTPGYSAPIHPLDTYLLPFQAYPWFGDKLDKIRTLNFFCASVNWSAFGTFQDLQELELSDFFCLESIAPGLLPTILNGAPQLRALTIGALREFALPTGYLLTSTSLRVLDVEFYRPAFVGGLLSAFHLPNLSTLVVRQVYSNVPLLLACYAETPATRLDTLYGRFIQSVLQLGLGAAF